MKRWILILLTLSLLITGCARLRGRKATAPASQPTAGPAPTEAGIQTPDEAAPAPTPDLNAMNFVEKNNLYIQLLEEKQAAGADTSQAEETYAHSLEASLNGDSAQADQYLNEAILLLWNQ